jgi:DICT domain-containing protein
MAMNEISPDTIRAMWTLSLVIYAVVVVVVATLLTLILRAARDIRVGVSGIWTVGQQIANNTIHIALLDTTTHVAGEILTCAKGIVAGTAGLQGHAEGCPGCPACVLGQETSR